jgi:hypothetical protein
LRLADAMVETNFPSPRDGLFGQDASLRIRSPMQTCLGQDNRGPNGPGSQTQILPGGNGIQSRGFGLSDVAGTELHPAELSQAIGDAEAICLRRERQALPYQVFRLPKPELFDGHEAS